MHAFVPIYPRFQTAVLKQKLVTCARPRFSGPKRHSILACTALNVADTATETSQCSCTLFGFETMTLSGCGVRLLMDPFIVGEMVIGSRNFFTLNISPECQGLEKVGDFDAVVLTSSLPDHMHEPSLREIAKSHPDVPVVAPKQSESMLRGFGFKNLILVSPGKATSVVPVQNSPVRILMGPATNFLPGITPQFAFLFDFKGSTVYYEPHGEHNPQFLQECQRADAIIVPGARAFTKGLEVSVAGDPEKSMQVVRTLKPSVLVTRNYDPATISATGWFPNLLQTEDATKIYCEQLNKDVEIIDLKFAQPTVIAKTAPAVN